MAKWKLNIFIILSAFIFIFFLIWINSFDNIEDILNNLDYHKEKIVHLKGDPLTYFCVPFTGSLYKLKDGTGSIWVISKEDTVGKTSSMYISGKIMTRLNISSDLDEKLKQYNLKINNFGPVIQEVKRENFFTTVKNIFK